MCYTKAQELYVYTEPASNMPTKSIGIRLNKQYMPSYTDTKTNVSNGNMYRINPEIMLGINKYIMLHANVYASNMHQNNFNLEGGGFYLKYRFISIDNRQTHFRIAAFAKASLINNKIQYNEINLSGDNSGIGSGIIATQLLHKLALSFTGGYIKSINNLYDELNTNQATQSYNYSLSSGYLLFPLQYKNYKQTNVNFYAEFLGKYNPSSKEDFVDIATAVQFIFISKMRLDIGYRRQITGNMLRINKQEFLVRFEYNIFNAY